MEENKLQYWTKFAFKKMRKDRTVMPTTITMVLELEEFRGSGVTEEELRKSIKEEFVRERQVIVNNMKDKLKKLNEKNHD